jgi:hypothetical protein
VLAHAQVLASSRTFGRDGLYVEVGENTRRQVENLVPVGHYIAISRATDDFTCRVREAGVWRMVTMPPGSLWVQPAKQPFSFDVTTTARPGAARSSIRCACAHCSASTRRSSR